ncbi:hypothetical protein [Enterovibrio norvegicus]|uniref:hypothetical protein n=1 Tax=Enterovibrio norvegicus TaxID=188144 RepID=UPI00352E308C
MKNFYDVTLSKPLSCDLYNSFCKLFGLVFVAKMRTLAADEVHTITDPNGLVLNEISNPRNAEAWVLKDAARRFADATFGTVNPNAQAFRLEHDGELNNSLVALGLTVFSSLEKCLMEVESNYMRWSDDMYFCVKHLGAVYPPTGVFSIQNINLARSPVLRYLQSIWPEKPEDWNCRQRLTALVILYAHAVTAEFDYKKQDVVEALQQAVSEEELADLIDDYCLSISVSELRGYSLDARGSIVSIN